MKNLQAFIDYLVRSRERQRRNIMFTTTLSVLVMLFVSLILTKPADSTTGDLVCGYEAHTHDAGCYVTDCSYDISEQTTDDEESDEQTTMHEHTNECFRLVCTLPEHIHSQDCYESEPESEQILTEDTSDLLSVIYNNDIQIAGEESAIQNEPVTLSDTEYFTSPVTQLPDGAINVYNNIISSIGGNETGSVKEGYENNGIKDVTFRISFSFDSSNGLDNLKNYPADSPLYLYYPLPEGVSFANELPNDSQPGETLTVKDDGKLAAYYTFSKASDGKEYIVLRVVDEYRKNILAEASDFKCSILFDSYVSRDNSTDDGDRTVQLGPDISSIIEFQDLKPSIQKDGWFNENANGTFNDGKPYAEWKIIIKNPAPATNLAGFTLTDQMLANAISGSITIKPDGCIDQSGWTIIKEPDNKGDPIEIVYRTEVDVDSVLQSDTKRIDNTATIRKDSVEYTDNASVSVASLATISKSVGEDFKQNPGSIQNKLVWTIDVQAKYGSSLAGFSVQDNAFETASDIEVLNGTGKLSYGTDYTITGGKLTFSDSVTAQSVKITYKTDITNEENKAQIILKDGTPGEEAKCTYNGTYKPFPDFYKRGEYDSKTNLIKWTVVFKPEYSYPDLSINGFTLEDPEFSRIADINNDGIIDKNDLSVKGYEDRFSSTTNIDWEFNGSILSFSTDESITGQYGKSKAIGAEVTYYVSPTDEQQSSLNSGNETKFTNEATLSNKTDPNDFTDKVSGECTYTPKNEVMKNLKTNDEHFIFIKGSTETKPLSWEVIMNQDMGFSGGTKALVDIMEVIDSTTNQPHPEADHYISTVQQENIKIYTKEDVYNSWSSTPLDSSYYEIKFFSDKEGQNLIADGENARSFTIVFNESVDSQKFKSIKIEYETTADVTNVTDPASLKFKNQTEFNGTTTEGKPFEGELQDKSSKSYKKIAIDENGNDITGKKSDLKDLKILTFNGVKYYVFGWDIVFTPTPYDSYVTLVDKLPEGFTLCTPNDSNDYCPKRKYVNQPWGNMSYYNYYHKYECSYVESENTVYFTFNQKTTEFARYFIKIPVDEFKPIVYKSGSAGYDVSNCIIDENNIFDPEIAAITITGEDTPDPITKNYIPHNDYGNTNTPQNDKGDNFINYTIDINPQSLDLSKTNELILKDAFSTISYDYNSNKQDGMMLVDAILTELKIYKVQADGTKGDELSTTEYSYQYYGQTPTKSEFMANATSKSSNVWKFDGFQSGDEVTVTLKAPPGTVIPQASNENTNQFILYIKRDWTDLETKMLNKDGPITFDDNGLYTYTFTVPDTCNFIEVANYASFQGYNIDDCDIIISRRASLSELNLIIPDETHLRLEYRYKLLKNGVRPDNGAVLEFKNEATLIGKDTIKVNVDDTKLTFSYDAAEASATTYPNIRKLDVGDYSITGLNAQFKLTVYDGTQWLWCNQELSTTGSTPTQIDISGWTANEEESKNIQTVNGEFKLNGLPTGKLLALVEVQSPSHSDHIYEDIEKIKPYYFVYSSSPEQLPDRGVKNEAIEKSSVKTINQGNEIPITNNRLIDITVNKTWSEQQVNPNITAELYWSYTKALTGFPSDMHKVEADELNLDSIENPATFSDQYIWHNLPNGKNGRPIYYYAVETAYSIDGKQYILDKTDELYKNGSDIGKYLPVYTGNAVNQENQQIAILNASSLQIEKQWLDGKNRPLPPNYWSESIEFKLYGKTSQNADEELIMNNGSETFTITADDDWICKLEPSLINKYYFFRVEEVNVPYGFNVSYKENYQGHTGKIIIANKNPVEPVVSLTIVKKWVDGGSTSRQTPTFKVLQSIDNQTWTYVESFTQSAPIENGNLWTFTIGNLPYRDESGNIYSYKIEEEPVDGYVLMKEVNNNGIPYGTIELTNTKTLKIDAEKIWNDSYKNEHVDKTIILKLFSSRNAADVSLNTSLPIVEEVAISATDNWKYTFDNLPMYNADDEALYYWVVEDNISGYETSYIYNDTAGQKSIIKNDGKIIVQNDFIYPDAALPSTGGTGTNLYYIIGTALILTGSIVYIISRKRIFKK